MNQLKKLYSDTKFLFKGLRDYSKVLPPEYFARSILPYSYQDNLALTSHRIRLKCDNLSLSDANIFTCIPINNWESSLLDAFASSSLNHVPFLINSSKFFCSKAEWTSYREHNSLDFRTFFFNYYNPNVINIIFFYVSDFHFDQKLLHDIYALRNTIFCLFSWDDRLFFKDVIRDQSVGLTRIMRNVDFCLSFSPLTFSRYNLHNANVFYWDIPSVTPKPPSTNVAKPTIKRVLFYGTRYGFRDKLVSVIRNAGIPIDVFGDGWGTSPLTNDDLIVLPHKYAVTLGSSLCGATKHISIIKGRDFEVPLNNGLYLTNFSESLVHIYKPEIEVLTYNSFPDCIRKMHLILDNPNAYASIRARGHLKAVAHTWDNRVNWLIGLIQSLLL